VDCRRGLVSDPVWILARKAGKYRYRRMLIYGCMEGRHIFIPDPGLDAGTVSKRKVPIPCHTLICRCVDYRHVLVLDPVWILVRGADVGTGSVVR
jgi:hypothetical protein